MSEDVFENMKKCTIYNFEEYALKTDIKNERSLEENFQIIIECQCSISQKLDELLQKDKRINQLLDRKLSMLEKDVDVLKEQMEQSEQEIGL